MSQEGDYLRQNAQMLQPPNWAKPTNNSGSGQDSRETQVMPQLETAVNPLLQLQENLAELGITTGELVGTTGGTVNVYQAAIEPGSLVEALKLARRDANLLGPKYVLRISKSTVEAVDVEVATTGLTTQALALNKPELPSAILILLNEPEDLTEWMQYMQEKYPPEAKDKRNYFLWRQILADSITHKLAANPMLAKQINPALATLLVPVDPNNYYTVSIEPKIDHVEWSKLPPGDLTQLIVSEAEILLPVGMTLAQIHTLGLQHCDLKPNNILFAPHTNPPRIMLIDFGLVAAADPNPTTREPKKSADGGAVLGTIHFMSPEAINNQANSAGRDVYAILTTAFKLEFDCYPRQFNQTEPVTALMIKALNNELTIDNQDELNKLFAGRAELGHLKAVDIRVWADFLRLGLSTEVNLRPQADVAIWFYTWLQSPDDAKRELAQKLFIYFANSRREQGQSLSEPEFSGSEAESIAFEQAVLCLCPADTPADFETLLARITSRVDAG